MILSDRTIREEIAAGRIVIEPLGDGCIQPSSVDLRLDRLFRVFLNHTMPVIDVKEDLEDLTRLVEIKEDDAFILHPGEFVLASTLERVALPDDLVARIEGKSSLGRLGLLIHSSLPGSEPILVWDGEQLTQRPIEEVVRKQLRGMVAAFDPDTFEIDYHEITGWYEGPPDRIYEVELASGRSIRLTAGHNLFTLDRDGEIRKVRTGELQPGIRVAVPGRIPDPVEEAADIVVADLVPESEYEHLTVSGPNVAAAFDRHGSHLRDLIRLFGYSAEYYRDRSRLPYKVAVAVPMLLDDLGPEDRINWKQGANPLPARIEVDTELAWLLGMYVAEGYRRDQQVVISNTDQSFLDRIGAALGSLGLSYNRAEGAITCGSRILSALMDWLGTGGKAPTKRVPPIVFGWPSGLIEAFLEGIVDGDGSTAQGRTSVWTTSDGLVADLLLLFARLGHRAGSCRRPARGNALPSWQVYAPDNEHKLLTSVPLPDQLLVDLRKECGLNQKEAARRAGYKYATDLNNIERRTGRDAVRLATLARLREAYSQTVSDVPSLLPRLDRLVEGDLRWDEVVAVRDTGSSETIYDIEVRPSGRKIENFVAGHGGVLASNTAGFIDAGFDGHITLELSNVANLPITLYPGMKVGQVSFLKMTTPADVPYGAGRGSKYQNQRGPTPSRYWENFK